MNKKNILIFFHPFYSIKDRLTNLLNHFKDYNIYFLLDNFNLDNKSIELLENAKKNNQISFYKIINFNKPIIDVEIDHIKSVVKKEILLICKKLDKINFDEIAVTDNTSYETKYIINSLKKSTTKISYYCNTNMPWFFFSRASKNKTTKKLAKLGRLKYSIYKFKRAINNFKNRLTNILKNFKKIILFKKIIILKKSNFLKISLDNNSIDKIYYFDENQKNYYEQIFSKKKIYPFNNYSRCNLNNHKNNSLLYGVDTFKHKNMHKKVIGIVIKDLTKILLVNNDIDTIIIRPHPREKSDINSILVKKINETFKLKTSLIDLSDYTVDDLFCNFSIYYGGASTLINIAIEKCKKMRIYYSKSLSDITSGYNDEYIGSDKLLKNRDNFFIID